jgi:hypothetical protein
MGDGRRRVMARRFARRPHALSVAELAWLTVLPCALVVGLAIVHLGPPLGSAFFEPSGEVIYPGVHIQPEPTEHARYALALLGPVLGAMVVVLAARRSIALPRLLGRLLVAVGQVAVVGALLACFLAAYDIDGLPSTPGRYFSIRTLIVAGAFAVLLAASLRSRTVLERAARWSRETAAVRIACAAIATAFTATWALRAINFESTVGNAAVLNLIPWQLSEVFAILNGRTPLVDFHSMYSQLWSYVGAMSMTVFGTSIGVWTITMAALSCLSVLAMYAVLRRVTRSSVFALALFLPFVAIGFWLLGPPGGETSTSIVSIFSVWPLRYGAPYLLAWLTARHLDGSAPRGTALLFLVAGLVAVNNLEFGVAALAGTWVACALVDRARWGRLLLHGAAGLLGAVAAVSVLTLVRAGELPRFGFLFEYPRLFGVDGWGLMSMPTIGLHLTMYGTFAGAIVVAVVRSLRDDRGRALTGMLGWSGMFGLLAGSYYVGRSEPGTLLCLFSAWSLALALLLVVVVRALAARTRRPALPELAVMFGFGLALPAITVTPTPWEQIERLRTPAEHLVYKQPAATAFVAKRTTPGERVAILAPLGHRIAHDLGL